MTVQMNKIIIKKQGFTLIELLVVVTILVIMGVIFTNILIESLRGRNKVNAINQVKQNGQVVLDKLSNEIREAEKIVCVAKYTGAGQNSGNAKDTIVIFKNGTFSQFRFFEPKPITAPTVNGSIRKMDFTSADLIDEDLENIVASSNLCTEYTPPPENFNQSLTDADSQKGVSVNLLDSQNVFEQRNDSVIIKFSASAGVKAGYAYDVTVKDGGVPFTTSVQVRGIKR